MVELATSQNQNKKIVSQSRGSKHNSILWTAVLTLAIVGVMLYSSFTGRMIAERYAPLIDAAMEIKLETAIGHLRFEEIISGDRTVSITDFEEHLYQAQWYACAMLEGGENPEGKFVPLEDATLRVEIEDVLAGISAFRAIAQERLKSRSQSSIGSDIDQRFDTTFHDLLGQADDVETALQRVMASHLQKFRVLQNILIAVIVVLGAVMGIVLQRHDRRRTIYIQALESKDKKLRSTYNELESANQQLTATEQQLRASNQQLAEEEEELRASNQQLRAPDQQLRAANQQLEGEITERKRVEQKLQKSKERLNLAMSVHNDGMFDWNVVTNRVFFDTRYYTMAGYEPNEFGDTFEECGTRVHPEDLVEVEEALSDISNRQKPKIRCRV